MSVLFLLFIAPVVVAKEGDKKDSEKTKITTVPAGEVVDKDFFALVQQFLPKRKFTSLLGRKKSSRLFDEYPTS